MASRKSQRLKVKTGAESTEPEDQLVAKDGSTPRRLASVYDAVAGTASSNPLLSSICLTIAGRVTSRVIKTKSHGPTTPTSPSRHTRDLTGGPALAPEEVLFRRKDAPPRYAEKDIYFAGSDSLPPNRKLPDPDLLKAVHGYAAGFYEAVAVEQEGKGKMGRVGGRLVDERTMDETALLAFGILLEEAGREALGKNGDLVFTEGMDEDGQTGMVGGEKPTDREMSKGGGVGGTESDDRASSKRLAKKRRLDGSAR